MVDTVVVLPVCISARDIQEARDTYLQELKAYIINDWPHKKEDVTHNIQKYLAISPELAMIDGVAVKGKQVIIPSQLGMQVLRQLHRNHIRIEKKRLLVHEWLYWVNMKADVEDAVKNCSTCLEYQNTQPQ